MACGHTDACDCLIVGGLNVDVAGNGTSDNPYIITVLNGGVYLTAVDSTTLEWDIGGAGTVDDPIRILAESIPSIPGQVYIDRFTTSGTWTKHPGTTTARVIVIGSGGGGAGGDNYNAENGVSYGGSGGGGGGYTEAFFNVADLPATVAVTVGAGGAGGAAKTTPGNGYVGSPGAATSFGAYLKAGGGAGGIGGGSGSADGISAGYGENPGGPGATHNALSGSGAHWNFTNDSWTLGAGGGGKGGNSVRLASSLPAVAGTKGGDGSASQAMGRSGGGTGVGLRNGQNGVATMGQDGSTDLGFGGSGGSGGGGGGGNSGTTAQQAGGNGGAGINGSGGGGGGAVATATANVPSGTGGRGGDGFAMVFSW